MNFRSITAPEDFERSGGPGRGGVTFLDASVSMIPKNTVEVTDEKIAQH